MGFISSFYGRKRETKTTAVGNMNRATEGGLLNELKLIEKEVKVLKEAGIKSTAINTAIRDYKNLISSIQRNVHNNHKLVQSKGEVSRSPEAIFGQYVSKADMEMIRNSAARIYNAADQYIADKNEELHGRAPGKSTKAKIDAVNHVRKFADKSRIISVEEQERTSASGRQATEQMLKLMHKPEPEAAPIAAPPVAPPAPEQQGRNSKKDVPKHNKL